jgi:hypothetical protein
MWTNSMAAARLTEGQTLLPLEGGKAVKGTKLSLRTSTLSQGQTYYYMKVDEQK